MDPYASEFDDFMARTRLEFGMALALSDRRAHALVTGITDAPLGPPPAWRRLFSRCTLAERERIRDRKRHGLTVWYLRDGGKMWAL